MAVFDDAGQAIEAALEAPRRLEGVEVDGHVPAAARRASTRAARGGSAATTSASTSTSPRASPRRPAPGEVLVSEAVHERIEDKAQLKRRWRFSAKGAPKGLKVYAAEPS